MRSSSRILAVTAHGVCLLQRGLAMEEIKRQVQRAQQRLVLEQFWRAFGWSLFCALVIAAIGLAIPRMWVLSTIEQRAWDMSWIGGGIAVGMLVAVIWTYMI